MSVCNPAGLKLSLMSVCVLAEMQLKCVFISRYQLMFFFPQFTIPIGDGKILLLRKVDEDQKFYI